MATNIGRVEFIVDLDGDKIPAQARKLGRQIAAAGKDSGEEFGEEFDSAFERSLTATGRKAAIAMGKAGRLGGESFTQDFESAVKSKSRSIQRTLAGTLADKDALAKSFEGFTTVTEAIEHYERELKAAGESVDSHADSLLEAADAEEKRRVAMEKSANAMKDIARQQELVNAEIDKLQRMSRDTIAIERAATEQRKTYTEVTANMRAEMERLHQQGNVSLTDVYRHNDALERSVEIIEERNQKEADAAQAALNRDARQADADDRREASLARQAVAEQERALRAETRFGKQMRFYDEIIAREDNVTESIRRTRYSIASLGETVEQTATRALRSSEEQVEANEEVAASHNKSRTMIDRLASSWRRLDGTVKLVVVSIVAAADEVAVLGSALGGGILALGGALSSVAVGGIGLVGLFSQLNQEIEEAPMALRGAIREYKELGEVFGEVGNVIAQSAVASMGDGFQDIENNIRDLTPALGAVGDMLGELIQDFGLATRAGGKAFGVLNEAIELGAGNFDSLARTSGTFGVALVRSFNEAQPLVVDFLGWLERLVTEFDTFTQSNGFDEWIKNAQTTFGAFSRLLDAVSRGLNDLVTPDAVARTEEFLDNLTRFTPSLISLLDTMGGLDAFGLAAQALADFGEALSPLADPLAELALALNEVLSVAIAAFAEQLSGLASFLAPAVEGIGDFLDAMPESTVRGIAAAITTLGFAFGTLNTVIALSAATAAMKKFMTVAAGTGSAASIATKGIGKLGAGLVKAGGLAVGVGILANALTNLAGASAKAAPGINVITEALLDGEGLDVAFRNASKGADSFAESLELVAGSSFDSGMERFGEGLGAVFGVQGQVTEARSGIEALDATLAGFVAAGDLDKAAAGFAKAEQAAAAQGIPIEELVKLFPQYEDALAGAGTASESAAEGFEGVGTAAENSIRSIEDLADAIRGYGDTQMSSADAQIAYNEALLGAQEALAENGATLANNTAEGLANQKALLGIAEATKEAAATTKDATGSQELANKEIEKGRNALIEMADQMGMTHDEAVLYADSLNLVADGSAEATDKERAARAELVNTLEQFGLNAEEAGLYADKLMALPTDRQTEVVLKGAEKAKGDADAVKQAIDRIQSKTVTITTKFTSSGQPIYRTSDGRELFARGGVVDQPTPGIFGEAGREALVPLNRPLNQVDPSVRALSAYAQGLSVPGGGGPTTSTSRVVNVQPGAIVIQGDRAPEATATNVVNRLAQRIAG